MSKIPMPETQRRIPKAPGRPRTLSEHYNLEEASYRDELRETLLNAKAAAAVANGQAKALLLRLVLDTQKALDAYDEREAERQRLLDEVAARHTAKDRDSLAGVMRQMTELMGGTK